MGGTVRARWSRGRLEPLETFELPATFAPRTLTSERTHNQKQVREWVHCSI
jgi:hypothetical protein